MQIPTTELKGKEKLILFLILLAFLVIPIISLIKVSINCLDAVNESQFKLDYQRYINQTYSNNKSDEEVFEQFNTYYKLNKTKKSDYDQYLGTIKNFDTYFYMKIYIEIILIVVDFLIIIFIVSVEFGGKIITICCSPCLTICNCYDCYKWCIKCFVEGSAFNPLSMQSIISLFLFIMSIFLVSEINKGRSQFNGLIEKIKQNNSKNNIEENIISISDPLSTLYHLKKSIILFLIFYLLLVIATITYSILRKVYFSKNLALFPTVNENQPEIQSKTQANNSNTEFNKNQYT